MNCPTCRGEIDSEPTSTRRPSPKLTVVDDDPDFILFLRDLSQAGHFTLLDAFTSAEETLQRLPKNVPDLVLMDIHLPGMSGIQCTKALKTAFPRLPVLAMTGFPDAAVFLRTVIAGVGGFLVKPFTNVELLSALDQAVAGEFPIARPAIPYLVHFIRQIQEFSDHESLTDREQEVLACTLMGLQIKEMAQRLGIGEATVHTHVQRMHEKLRVHNKKEIIARYFKIT